MSKRSGLYEYLGVEVTARSDEGTRVTEKDHETHDDQGLGLDILGEGSSATFTPGETYDDDPGFGGLDIRDEGSLDTRTDGETYDDDPGLEGLGYLNWGAQRSSESTVITKVLAETHDDSGLGGLADL